MPPDNEQWDRVRTEHPVVLWIWIDNTLHALHIDYESLQADRLGSYCMFQLWNKVYIEIKLKDHVSRREASQVILHICIIKTFINTEMNLTYPHDEPPTSQWLIHVTCIPDFLLPDQSSDRYSS